MPNAFFGPFYWEYGPESIWLISGISTLHLLLLLTLSVYLFVREMKLADSSSSLSGASARQYHHVFRNFDELRNTHQVSGCNGDYFDSNCHIGFPFSTGASGQLFEKAGVRALKRRPRCSTSTDTVPWGSPVLRPVGCATHLHSQAATA